MPHAPTTVHPQYQPVSFVKMHGVGNDFVVVDLVAAVPVESHQAGNASQYHVDNAARTALSRFLHQHLLQSPLDWEFPKGVVRQLASRELGVGCDQVVVLCEGNVNGPDNQVSASSTAALARHVAQCHPTPLLQPAEVWCSARIFNGSDGAEVEMCGNAVRCIAWYWAVQQAIRGASSSSVVAPKLGDDAHSGACLNRATVVHVFLPASKRCMPCTVETDDGLLHSCVAAAHQIATAGPQSSLPLSLPRVMAATGTATANVVVQFGQTDVVLGVGDAEDDDVVCRLGAKDVGVPVMVEFMAGKDPILAQLLADHTDAVYAVKVGNPHCVLLAKPSDGSNGSNPLQSDAVVAAAGKYLNQWHQMFPNGVNAEFAALYPLAVGEREQAIRMRVFERGAGLTKACGSGACATTVAAHAHLGGAPRSTLVSRVEMDGGELIVNTTPSDDGRFANITVAGAAAFTFCGEWLPLV